MSHCRGPSDKRRVWGESERSMTLRSIDKIVIGSVGYKWDWKAMAPPAQWMAKGVGLGRAGEWCLLVADFLHCQAPYMKFPIPHEED